ncbi:MAG TPA: hypothetical protein VGT98_06640 [Candidatus Elarobacter sp.]|nr:hypothetical protein [Candidatus Elarobacter sp.]
MNDEPATCLPDSTISAIAIGWPALFVRWANVSGPASAFYCALVATLVLVPSRDVHGGSPTTITHLRAARTGVSL